MKKDGSTVFFLEIGRHVKKNSSNSSSLFGSQANEDSEGSDDDVELLVRLGASQRR